MGSKVIGRFGFFFKEISISLQSEHNWRSWDAFGMGCSWDALGWSGMLWGYLGMLFGHPEYNRQLSSAIEIKQSWQHYVYCILS